MLGIEAMTLISEPKTDPVHVLYPTILTVQRPFEFEKLFW